MVACASRTELWSLSCETIETTMKFYVGSNAETTADILWSAYEEFRTSNTFGNSGQNEPERINKPK